MAQKLWIESDPFSKFSEAIRSLRETLYSHFSGNEPPVVVLSSPHKGDGCSTITANLAISSAQSGRRTIVIDADIVERGLGGIFESSHKAGLLELIAGEKAQPISTGIDNCSFLPAGNASIGQHPFDSPKLKSVIDELKKTYDMILIDTAPVLETSDAIVLGQKASGIILVFRAGNFIREDEIVARELLERSGVKILGAIVNRMREEDRDPYYTYQRFMEKRDK